ELPLWHIDAAGIARAFLRLPRRYRRRPMWEGGVHTISRVAHPVLILLSRRFSSQARAPVGRFLYRRLSFGVRIFTFISLDEVTVGTNAPAAFGFRDVLRR